MLLSRLALTLVFASAGVAKLASRPATEDAVAGFGLPRRLAVPLSVALPLVELAVGAALLVPRAARWGAAAALALLASFLVGMFAALLRGRRPECNCFGARQGSRIGPRSVARNLVLLAVAVLATEPTKGSGLLTGTVRAPVGLVLGLAAVLLVEGFLIWQLLGQGRRLLERLDRMEASTSPPFDVRHHAHSKQLVLGSPAPEFRLRGPDDVEQSLHDLVGASQHGVALVFANPGCGACDRVLDHLATAPVRPDAAVAVIARGEVGHVRMLLTGAPAAPVVLAGDDGVGAAYGIGPVPAAVLIDRRARVASDVVVGEAAVLALLHGRRSFALVAG